MASFQPAGIVAKIANSFYGHLDEKKKYLLPAFWPPDDNQSKHMWPAAPCSIKAFSEVPSTQFRF